MYVCKAMSADVLPPSAPEYGQTENLYSSSLST